MFVTLQKDRMVQTRKTTKEQGAGKEKKGEKEKKGDSEKFNKEKNRYQHVHQKAFGMCYEAAKAKGKLPTAGPPKTLKEANEIMGSILKASKNKEKEDAAEEKKNDAAKFELQLARRRLESHFSGGKGGKGIRDDLRCRQGQGPAAHRGTAKQLKGSQLNHERDSRCLEKEEKGRCC